MVEGGGAKRQHDRVRWGRRVPFPWTRGLICDSCHWWLTIKQMVVCLRRNVGKVLIESDWLKNEGELKCEHLDWA